MAEEKIHKTNLQWHDQLTPEQYEVTREKGTEQPFSGHYEVSPIQGTFHCICCDAPLFRTDNQFDAHCGWPSFDQPLADAALEEHIDLSHNMRRIEVTCRRCDAHLGHVFPDGPHQTTGLRYCINSVALRFHPAD